MTMTPANWSLGVYIGIPAFIIVMLVTLGVIVFGIAWRIRDDIEPGLGTFIAVVGVGALIADLMISGFFFWPWRADYHRYYHVTGKVERVSSRFIADGNSTSQRYVVVLGGQPFAVDDTRASLLHAGDRVSLLCKREYVYQSRSGWACNWD